VREALLLQGGEALVSQAIFSRANSMDALVDALLDSITPGNRADASPTIQYGMLMRTTVSNDTLLAFGLLLSPQTVTAALDLVETHAGGH
jgi:hypothetical protein